MQFGRALCRILQQVSDAYPRLGPVHLSKINIADGFYCIWMKAEDVPKHGIMFPTEGEQLVGFPLVLPMGWMQSPPLFTAATETVADLVNDCLRDRLSCGPNLLDDISETPPPVTPKVPRVNTGRAPTQIPHQPILTGRPSPPVKSWDVYVDDFIGMFQGNKHHRQHVKRVILHALDSVFRKLEHTDGPHLKEPASINNMLKGDATWATRKNILGWIVDTIKMTVELPQHSIDRFFELLDSVAPGQGRASTNTWEKLLGELRSMVLAIPGGRGLFIVLQEVLKKRCDDGTRVRLTLTANADFPLRPSRLSLARHGHGAAAHEDCRTDSGTAPSHIGGPRFLGHRHGWGSFRSSPNGRVQPLLWWSKFEDRLPSQLVTFANPGGTVTNSNLELAASIAQHDVLAQQVDVREATIHNLTDNTATIYWQRRGATSTTGQASRMLPIQSLHQQHHHYVHSFDYILGEANAMPDDCIRRWDLTDTQLIAHFYLVFPQSQP
jgi:hypothetical protein